MTNFERVSAFLVACDKDRTAHNTSYQTGDLLWAMVEFLEAINVSGPQSEDDVATAIRRLRRAGGAMKRGQTLAVIQADKRADALKALCNIDANANGVAYLGLMDKGAADNAVLTAMEAMLVDGVPTLAPGGKVTAPEGWQPASVSEYV